EMTKTKKYVESADIALALTGDAAARVRVEVLLPWTNLLTDEAEKVAVKLLEARKAGKSVEQACRERLDGNLMDGLLSCFGGQLLAMANVFLPDLPKTIAVALILSRVSDGAIRMAQSMDKQ